MAPLGQTEKDDLATKLLKRLSYSPYACSSLTQLVNGTTNFVFRGILAEPLKDGITLNITTVIVKHCAHFAGGNQDLPIDVSRCICEESMLKALKSLEYTNASVKVPHLFMFDSETNTQVIEDFPSAVDLQTVLISPTINNTLSEVLSTSIGRALGLWLRYFHNWTSAPLQADLRAKIEGNEAMRKLKYLISYETFVQVLEQFPEILAGNREIMEKVKNMAAKEFQKTAEDGPGEDWGVIHGDFWSGNVLLPSNISLQKQGELKLFVIDWEFTQFGHRAYDIGQLIGDLYEREYFQNVDSAVWIIQGFIDGYGALSEEMVFRTAIHVGMQLVCWCKRGPPLHMRPQWSTPGLIAGVVKLGVNFIVKGWEKDREWLESGALKGLFKHN